MIFSYHLNAMLLLHIFKFFIQEGAIVNPNFTNLDLV